MRVSQDSHHLHENRRTPDSWNGVPSSRASDAPPPTEDSRWIQQHLANERTFLAWIRTVIAILGVGFVTTSLHFELSTRKDFAANIMIEGLGLVTVVISAIAVAFTAWSYGRKRRGINTSTFQSTSLFVVFLSSSIGVLVIVMLIYLLFAF